MNHLSVFELLLTNHLTWMRTNLRIVEHLINSRTPQIIMSYNYYANDSAIKQMALLGRLVAPGWGRRFATTPGLS